MANKIADNVLDLIGNTPMVRLNRIVPRGSTVLAKLEYTTPPAASRTGSRST